MKALLLSAVLTAVPLVIAIEESLPVMSVDLTREAVLLMVGSPVEISATDEVEAAETLSTDPDLLAGSALELLELVRLGGLLAMLEVATLSEDLIALECSTEGVNEALRARLV